MSTKKLQIINGDGFIFPNNITLAGNYTQVGNVTKTQDGTATLNTQGKTAIQVLTELLSQRLQPTITAPPAITINFSQAGAHEVGEEITPSYTATLSAGSYTYGVAGVIASEWRITDTNSHDVTQTSAAATGTFDTFTVTDSTNYTITAVATHGEGLIAKDNLGTNSSPIVKIASGTKTKTSSAVTGFRKTFYGCKTIVDGDLTSADIRALTGRQSQAETFSMTIPEGCKQVIVAVPAARTLVKVEDQGAFGTDISSSFVQSTKNIDGAKADTATSYKIYQYLPAAALGANTYNVIIS